MSDSGFSMENGVEMWEQFRSGETIGTKGSESGTIIKDEEHECGARITLEAAGIVAPFSITCGIYGWMFHTRFFSNEIEAMQQFDAMKAEMSRILDLIPFVEDPEAEEKREIVGKAIAEFVERFP